MLRHHNCLRVNFATFALVTQALLPYRHKLLKILDDPCKGQAGLLHGEQIPIKQAWLALYKWEATGSYNMNKLQWTCSCGAQKYHSYLLCKHLVKAVGHPGPNLWATVV